MHPAYNYKIIIAQHFPFINIIKFYLFVYFFVRIECYHLKRKEE